MVYLCSLVSSDYNIAINIIGGIKMDWKELGQKALIGAVYGAAGALVVIQNFKIALFSAVAVGIIRGASLAVLEYLEPKTTSVKGFKQKTGAGKFRELF